jgi:hypothetical protein
MWYINCRAKRQLTNVRKGHQKVNPVHPEIHELYRLLFIVRFEVLTSVSINKVFWTVMPFNLAYICRSFGGTCYLNLQNFLIDHMVSYSKQRFIYILAT